MKAAEERRAVALAVNIANGSAYVLPDQSTPDAVAEAAADALLRDKTGTMTINGEAWFIEARNPAPRLAIIGAVHIAQALAPLAAMTGFDVTIIDPRRAFGNQERFPGVSISTEWPDVALATLNPDMRTAIVTLTHDPKLDDPALDQALRSEVFYIGALGSRKTHAARLERLAALGHGQAALDRIHGPVGLNIGAVTATEIALSIIAEITAIRRAGVQRST